MLKYFITHNVIDAPVYENNITLLQKNTRIGFIFTKVPEARCQQIINSLTRFTDTLIAKFG